MDTRHMILEDLDVMFRDLPEGEDPGAHLAQVTSEPVRPERPPRSDRSVTWRGPSTLTEPLPDAGLDVVFR